MADTQFQRDDLYLLGQACSDLSNIIPLTVSTGAAAFFTPDSSLVTTPTTYNMCAGPQSFSASGGLSYEFRINGLVVFTTSSTAPGNLITFDPLTDFTTSTYALATFDEVDVLVYDLGLTASGTIDPTSCSYASEVVTVTVAATPSFTLTTASNTVYCPGETTSFTIIPFTISSSITYRYTVTGFTTWTALGTNTTFGIIMPNLAGPASIATVTVEATNSFCPSSPAVVSTLALRENELTSAGVVSPVDETFCFNTEPADIIEITAPSASVTGTTYTYQWEYRTTSSTTWTAITTPQGVQRDLLSVAGG